MNKLIALAIQQDEPELELMIHSELLELKKRKVRKILEQEYLLENIDTFSTKLKEIEDNNKMKLKEQTAKEHNNGYLWVTINPKEDVTLADFCKRVAKISTKTCFADVLYVLEQRAAQMTSLGKGFHAHMLVKRNLKYKPIKLIQNIKNSCKKIVGNINADYCLNFQVVGEDYARDKKEYILGIKTGKDEHGNKKSAKQQLDPIWREKENLKKYYGNKNIV
jgi:hypothetical protein